MKLSISPFLLCALLAPRSAAQDAPFDLERTTSVLSRLIEESLEQNATASLSIALVRHDEIVWTAAFGWANVATGSPATPATIYCTGSTFKAVTATALVQLAETNKLDLDDPVNLHLGDAPIRDRSDQEKPVTIRHILSHWSGLAPGANTVFLWSRESPQTLEELAAGLHSVRDPAEQWEYNNYAYGLAGLLVERISGRSYERYIVRKILRPLGVKTAHPVAPSPEMVERMALPYIPSADGPRPVPQVQYDVFPAGDIYLTAEDMARFLGAHLNGGVFNGKRILSEESVKTMHTPQFSGAYAFGFMVNVDPNGHTIIQHTGGTPGFSSLMIGDVTAGVGAYFMSTSQAPGTIGQAALALLRGEDYVAPWEREPVEVSPATLEEYVGVYEHEEGGEPVRVTLVDGVLYTRRQLPRPTPCVPLSEAVFLLEGVGATLTFERDEGGRVSGLVFRHGLIVQRARRVR